MAGLSTLAYAQARMQSRYGARAEATVWLKLHNIHDLGSYMQTAQQTPLRPWVQGLSRIHSSHDLELALRQKYRHHVDEVASWLPSDWRAPVRWLKTLVDLPALHYLMSGGEPLAWMRADPVLKAYTADQTNDRLRALRAAGSRIMVDEWQQSRAMLSGWFLQWQDLRPKSMGFERGLRLFEQQMRDQFHRLATQQSPGADQDYEVLLDRLRLIFRRYAFEPTAVCAYLFVVAIDLHHIRSDLMQRLFFERGQVFEEDLR
jgi:hypothetical protein